MIRYIINTPNGLDYEHTYKSYQAARYWKKEADTIQRVVINPYTEPKLPPRNVFTTELFPTARPNNTPRSKKGRHT